MKEFIFFHSSQKDICTALNDIGKGNKLYTTVPIANKDTLSPLTASNWELSSLESGSHRSAGSSVQNLSKLGRCSKETEALYAQKIAQTILKAFEICPNVKVDWALFTANVMYYPDKSEGLSLPIQTTKQEFLNKVTDVEVRFSMPFDSATLQSRVLDPHNNTIISPNFGELLFFNRDEVQAGAPHVYKPFCRNRFENYECAHQDEYKKPSLILISIIKHREPYISSQFMILALVSVLMIYLARRQYLSKSNKMPLAVEEQQDESLRFQKK